MSEFGVLSEEFSFASVIVGKKKSHA